MMGLGKFVYDGWIPISDWSESSIESIVSSLHRFFKCCFLWWDNITLIGNPSIMMKKALFHRT